MPGLKLEVFESLGPKSGSTTVVIERKCRSRTHVCRPTTQAMPLDGKIANGRGERGSDTDRSRACEQPSPFGLHLSGGAGTHHQIGSGLRLRSLRRNSLPQLARESLAPVVLDAYAAR